ncbi:hypothetical protein HNR77_001213 [Paenibacillus sp. JGP012]|nr:hypothetical protein [Paenibacillus sp. JGP012]
MVREVWFLLPSEPHEHHIFENRLGDLPGRIDALGVGVDDDFSEHLGMIAVSCGVPCQGRLNVQFWRRGWS